MYQGITAGKNETKDQDRSVPRIRCARSGNPNHHARWRLLKCARTCYFLPASTLGNRILGFPEFPRFLKVKAYRCMMNTKNINIYTYIYIWRYALHVYTLLGNLCGPPLLCVTLPAFPAQGKRRSQRQRICAARRRIWRLRVLGRRSESGIA